MVPGDFDGSNYQFCSSIPSWILRWTRRLGPPCLRAACLLHSAADQLGPHQSARPTASDPISWDGISQVLLTRPYTMVRVRHDRAR